MKEQSYAQKAKSIMNRYKIRLGENFDRGDTLANEAMTAELKKLQQEQEIQRVAELPPEQQTQDMMTGQGLGLGPQDDRGIEARATGEVPELAFGGLLGTGLQSNLSNVLTPEMQTQSSYDQGFVPFQSNFTDNSNLNTILDSNSNIDSTYKSRVPWAGSVSQGLSGILGNRQLDLPEYNYDEYTPTRVAANTVDYSRGREQTMRERDQANAIIGRNARGTGSQAGLMENILAGTTGTQRTAGTAFNQSIEQEGNTNAQIRNQASQFNAAQTTQAAQLNMQQEMFASRQERENAMINAQRKDAQFASVGDALTGYGKDILKAGQYDQMMNMMKPEDYEVFNAKDSKLRRLLGISPDMGIRYSGQGDTATG